METPSISKSQESQDVIHWNPTDAEIYSMWIHGRPENTKRAYEQDIRRMFDFLGPRALRQITLQDLQHFSDSLLKLAPSTKGRILSTVKSLFRFVYEQSFIPANPAKSLRVPRRKDTLAERILSEAEVHRMIALETNPRNTLLLKLLYASGARVSEVCDLKWRDCAPNGDGGQITIHGKGEKTRYVRLPAPIWKMLVEYGAGSARNDPVFVSRLGGHLSPVQAYRIVRSAAERAGIYREVSCHWLRHSHATHSLERGAPIHLVMATLGHSDASTTTKYLHARPDDSSSMYLSV